MTTSRPVDTLPAAPTRPAGTPHALAGVRVLDFTRFLAGPWCTQTLADFGAEVIKVESPGIGDETRTYKPPELAGESPYFLGLNRNKKSIALDLKSAAGRQIATQLAEKADIIVENFSPGVMNRLGLGYETLARSNPRLVFCSLSGYASDGRLADQPGFDSVFQAESGLAWLTGDPDRLPIRTGTPIVDVAASMNATIAILAALAARERYGAGQHVEVALFDTAVTMLAYFSMNYLASGKEPVRNGNTAPVATPIGMFETADGGAVYVSCGTRRSWEKLAVEVLERPDLVKDPRFAEHRARNENQAVLMDILADIFLKRPRDAWMERAHRYKVPVGAVRSVGEALASPAAIERPIATRLAHPSGDPVPNITPPFRMSATPVADPSPARALGEDRDTVLWSVLGYEDERIARLAGEGAFGAASESRHAQSGRRN